MRTKTLLTAVAALAAGIAISKAQVYSANIVGYASKVLPAGYSLITVPLNATNVGNTVPASQVLSSLQSGDSVILWNGSGYSTYGYANFGPGFTWIYPDSSFSDTPPNLTLGSGFFYQNAQGVPETNVFTGTVVLSNSIPLIAGYSLVGSTPPVSGAVSNNATFNLPLTSGDSIILWNGSGYSTYGYANFGPGFTWIYPDSSFSDTPPTVGIGDGFFYQNGQGSLETWQQNVVVQ